MSRDQEWSSKTKKEYGKQEKDNKESVEGVRDATFEIVEKIGVINDFSNGDCRIELNLIRWNNKPPVYDLRLWVREDGESFKPLNGLKFYYKDLLILSKILADL